MKKYSIFILLLCMGSLLFSQSFQNLKEYKQNGNILYEPSISTIINTADESDYGVVYKILKTKINKNSPTVYLITFDYGPSEDHTYTIYKETGSGNFVELGSIGAEKIVIPGNGYIYGSGRNNQLYNKKRKFKISGTEIIEVKQAAYYIGLQTQTNKMLTLYADKEGKEKSAVLPKNYSIEVLIEQDECILIKTPFGLTGWAKLSDLVTYDMTGQNLSIKGFYYAGD
jgi:hypothetical protein